MNDFNITDSEELIFANNDTDYWNAQRLYYLASGSGRDARDTDDEIEKNPYPSTGNWNIFGG